MNILNLTQHPATPDQQKQGVIDLQGQDLKELKYLLTFTFQPTKAEIEQRAQAIAALAARHNSQGHNSQAGMIAGAPYLMSALEKALNHFGIAAVYAYSERESIETVMEDGSVKKENVFRHKGFISV